MSGRIPVSAETKAALERKRRDDESFDELLVRLANRAELIAIDAWDDQTAERARAGIDRSRRSFDR